jgi:phytoene synthase
MFPERCGVSAPNRHQTLSGHLHSALPLDQRWSVDASFAYCTRLARSHYENFPVGSLLIPRRLQKHFHSIYAFARTADDFADERLDPPRTAEERLALLREWRLMLNEVYQGRPSHPIFVALAETVRQFELPIELFEDLLSAFSQDVTVQRYSTFADLLDYCRRSANPVGRLVLLLFGRREETLLRRSDSICTALQLTNHWQDLSIDLAKDRLYLPKEDLARFGVTVDDIVARRHPDRFRELMAFQVARTRELFEDGKGLASNVQGRLGIELRAVWLGGRRILERIEASRYDVLSSRPVLTRLDRLKILASALSRRGFASQ